MADIKISQLPAAAAALGTQEFEVNESGTSKKVTGAQIDAYVKGSLVAADITDLTATAAELNTLDGITASTSELNTLDGITASTSELNTLDGITATTSQLNNTQFLPSVGPLSNRNKIINGAMQVAQRGTSGSGVGSAGYVAIDRWRIGIDTSSTVFLSQLVFAAGQSDVDRNLEYYAKFDWLGTGTAQTKTVSQRIEGVSSLNGQQVTVSFYGRTELADDVIVKLKQNFGSGGSTEVITSSSTIDLTASWAKYTVTLALPSISGKTVGASSYLELEFSFGPATANSYFEFTGVQLEAGDTATPFEHRSYGQELALCQRYYQKSYPTGNVFGDNENTGCFGFIPQNTDDNVNVNFPVKMRASPTVRTIRKNGGAENQAQIAANSGLYIGLTIVLISDAGFDFVPDTASTRRYRFHYDANAEL